MTTWYVDLIGGTDTFRTKSITGATKANPCVITSASHGYQNGQVVVITGVAGMTQLNGNTYTVDNVALNTYELSGINSTAYDVYTSGGISTITGKVITNITQANPCVITCSDHGYSNDDYISVIGVEGMTELNDRSFKVANKTADTFELLGVDSSGYAAWSSGGTSQRVFLTVNGAQGLAEAGEEIRIGSTGGPTQYTSSNLTWTNNSNSVATSASLIGVITAGNYIGRPGAAGNGSTETYYRVTAITAAAITLESKYYGTTGTDVASVYKITPQVTGSAGVTAITIGKSIILSGGWDLTNSIQNGETWFRTNALRTAGNINGIVVSSSCTISKINILECYRSMLINVNDVIVSNCTCSGSQIYNIDASSRTAISNTILNGVGGSYGSLAIGVNGDCSLVNFVAMGNFNGTACSVGNGGRISGGIFVNSATGCNQNINTVVENCTFLNCRNGVTLSSNSKVSNCSFTNMEAGVYFAGQQNSLLVSECSFVNCTIYAVHIIQSRGAILVNNTFLSNQIDVYIDGYSSDVTCINNTHTTPTAYAYSRTLSGGCYTLYNCSIDIPSIAKAFLVVSGASYSLPQYIIQNSFGGLYGTYWANGQVTKDASVFRTAGPSLKIAYNTTVAFNFFDIKIVSCYAKASQAKKFSLYIKRDLPEWTGTIVPHFKLDGITLSTETTITSLTTDWVLYEWICPAVYMATDGELSMEFTLNSNNTAIWIDDFTVVDI